MLQDLGAFLGLGWSLIQAGLRSPVIHNRNMALNAARRQERDQQVRARIDRVLKGQLLAD